MSKRSTIAVAALAVVAIVVIVFASVHARAPKKIVIGFIGPLTGNPSIWGVGSRNMVALAAEDINAKGGINGTPIEIDFQDGKCAVQDAVSAFKHLQLQNVTYILGGHCSTETSAIAPLTKDGKTLIVAGLTVANGAMGGSDYAYRTSPDTIGVTNVMTPFIKGRYQKIATITELTPYAKSFTTDFEAGVKKEGIEIVAHEEFQPNTTDVRTLIMHIKQSGADAIMVSPQGPVTATTVMKQLSELGIQLPVFGNTIFVSQEVYDNSGKPPNMLGAFATGPYTDPTQPRAKALTEKYLAKYGTAVPYSLYYVGASYDAMMMLADAIKKCGNNTTCSTNYFETVEYQGEVGNYKFKENGDIQNVNWAKISISQEGKLKVEAIK